MNKGLFEGVIAALWQGCKLVIENHADRCADLQNCVSYDAPDGWMGTGRPLDFLGQLSPAAEGDAVRPELLLGQNCLHWGHGALLFSDHLWYPEAVPAPKGRCSEVSPGVSSHLLCPVCGARLSPQGFPQGECMSMACGWQPGMPGHFSFPSLKVKPRSLISPIIRSPCMAQLS